MKTRKLNRVRIGMITETLTDYLGHYFEEEGDMDDVSYVVNERFDEFVMWACDDLIISTDERDILLDGNERELINTIKLAGAGGFKMRNLPSHSSCRTS